MENTKVTETKWVDFPITVGIRCRLTQDQKQLIKDAYDRIGNAAPQVQEGRGGIQVVTQQNPKQSLIVEMGVDRVVLSSLLGSNERLPLGTLIKWESVLGLEGKLVSKKEVDAAYKSLLSHLGMK